MGLDNFTSIVYGWKIKGRKKVEQFSDELSEINVDWCDDTDGVIIDDTMCGDYMYVGAILDRYDADEGGEVIIDNKLSKKATNKFNSWMKDNPKYAEIINKYIEKTKPQLYVFQNIW